MKIPPYNLTVRPLFVAAVLVFMLSGLALAQAQSPAGTIRGQVTGPEFTATARVLAPEEHKHARETINGKYWMARIPLIWSRTDTYFEITFA